jgi:hypothetical protein
MIMPELQRFYIDEMLGEHMGETPEGFLICHDVPIARIGHYEYKSTEVPTVKGSTDGMVKILRNPDDVFCESAVRSFEGKPVTINHPNTFVTPDNWKDLAVGQIQNVRRGDGDQDDLLIADLFLTASDAISLVKSGLRQVSCGYDAEYEQLDPGVGKQKNIIGNHVALVVKGRAGNRCAIMDSECSCCGNCMCGNKNKTSKEDEIKMGTTKMKDVLRRIFPKLNLDSVKDEDLELAEGGATGEGAGIEAAQAAAAEAKNAAVQAVEAAKQAQAAVEGAATAAPAEPAVEAEKLEGQDDEGGEAGGDPIAVLTEKVDELTFLVQQLLSAIMGGEEAGGEEAGGEEAGGSNSEEAAELGTDGEECSEEEKAEELLRAGKTTDALWQDTISRAEVISPGIVATKPKVTDLKKVVTAVKRTALSNAMTRDSAMIIKPLLRGKKISALTEDALDAVFVGASELIGKTNNAKVQAAKSFQMNDVGNTRMIEGINQKNRDFWKNKKR